jgi:CheY-like chemotaxis protein
MAHSAATALQITVQFVPSIVFLDIDLPDMSGYELALHLHQHRQLQQMRHPIRAQLLISTRSLCVALLELCDDLRMLLSRQVVSE